MSTDTTPQEKPFQDTPSLEQLLRRSDIWRGHSHAFTQAPAVDSGYPTLNRALQHHGWPVGCVIEVCQRFHACEWWLFHPAMKTLIGENQSGHIALLNPPALPFVSGLKKVGIPTDRIIVIQTTTVQEFVTCFTELSRSSACPVVFAWQPQQHLNYTQLRKLQLSATEQSGLYVVFRQLRAKEQSSPASLRLTLIPQHDSIQLHIFKQKGKLHHLDVDIPIPACWKRLPPHRHLQREKKNEIDIAYKASTKRQIALLPQITSRPLKKVVKRDYR